MTWAIRIPFEDSWLCVTDGPVDNPRPVVYNTKEAAESAAVIWTNYEVVEYEEDILWETRTQICASSGIRFHHGHF